MTKSNCAVFFILCIVSAVARAEGHDFYKHHRYPSKLVPGVGLDKIDQEGGPSAVGYKRRTVQWWPRKGQDIVDIPAGAPLRTWTRNKGQIDAEAFAGVCRTWTAADPEKFEAHLIAFRSFGTSTYMSDDPTSVHIPQAVLRMEDGRVRAIVNYKPFSRMVSDEDHTFIHKTWEKAFPKLYAKVTQGDLPQTSKLKLKRLEGVNPKFNAIPQPANSKYPLYAEAPDTIEIESPHFYTVAHPKAWGRPGGWCNSNIEYRNRYRQHILEFLENFWTYMEASGSSMPYWRRSGENHKYQIHIWRSRCAGGWGHCGIGDCNTVAFGHEFFHGQPMGGYPGGETTCNAGQHYTIPAELQMFNGNFRYPWRNANYMQYQSSLPLFALADNPNWASGAVVLGCLASRDDHTWYHTIARLGQKKGLWKNGVRGVGDFFGEYAARMVTCDFVEQFSLRSKYGMPECGYLHPVYGQKNRWRISNAEAPRWGGFNIIRLNVDEGAEEITVDFAGDHDPKLHSDWRACIVAVDGAGKARYSPMWNKGKMSFKLKTTDTHVWLSVSACPSAFPVNKDDDRGHSFPSLFLTNHQAPRYPWEASFEGCRPGTPNRMQGDIENFDELFGRCDSGNTYLNYAVKHEIPIPLSHKHGKLAQAKLKEMIPRLKASADALEAKVQAGKLNKGYFWSKRNMMHIDMARRMKLLQENAQGKPHPNGGGFVSDNAKVAATAYVGPGAMVFDGATVKDNACVKDFAVVFGPKTVIAGNAKISGRAWVTGDLKVTGNARIGEGAAVTTVLRTPRTPSVRYEGKAEITGSAVIKGDCYLHLCRADDIVLTGGIVLDYEAAVEARAGGVYSHGRFYRWGDRRVSAFSTGAADEGAIFANYQFNQPKTAVLEDYYVNNNGTLHGAPKFVSEGARKSFAFNGANQYAIAPPGVADFGELTVDMAINRSGGGRLFDFGTGDDECFHLAIAGDGKLTLTARHAGKSLSLSSSQNVPAGEWAAVRVEMDGKNAAIFIDGKPAAKKAFAFSPRDVFIGDRAEGNFIACGRGGKEFYKGRIDHFRIYRRVNADFEAIGPPPSALTQEPDWSPEDQKLHDDWAARRMAAEGQLAAGKYGQMQGEIKKLERQRSELYKVKSAKLKDIEAKAKQASDAKRDLDRKMHDEYNNLPQRTRAEKDIRELRIKIDTIRREIRERDQCEKIRKEIKTRETRRREIEDRIRRSPEIKAIEAKRDAAAKARREAETAIAQLPEIRKLKDQADKEKDGKKRRVLQDKLRNLTESKKRSDPKWQKAGRMQKEFDNASRTLLRKKIDSDPERKKNESQIRKLHQDLRDTTAKLEKSHPKLSGLDKTARDKQEALNAKRKQIEERHRSSQAYKDAETRRVAADKAVREVRDADRKRIEQSGEFTGLADRIARLRAEAAAVRDAALKAAGLYGSNPYPGQRAADAQAERKKFVHHTTADWSHDVLGDNRGGEATAPAKMIRWLKDVRGF